MSRGRADALLVIVRDLEACVRRLDALQVGDYQGKVSPIKHTLRDALSAPVERIRELARAEYTDREGKLSPRDNDATDEEWDAIGFQTVHLADGGELGGDE